MSLYNLTNYSTSRSPIVWLKTSNTLSGGALGVGLPIVIWLIIFVSLAAKGLSKYAFITASFLTTTITLPLVIAGICTWTILFVFIILSCIGAAMLIYDKGY